MVDGEWYYSENGERRGPVDAAMLKRMSEIGAIQPSTLVWRTGLSDWEPAHRHIPGLVPPPPPGPGVRPAMSGAATWDGGAPPVAGGRDYQERVGMGEAFGRFWRRYFDFAGRSNRGEYWWAILALIIVGIVIGLIDGAAFSGSEVQPLSSIWSLATFLPTLSLAVRRLHDIDRTGWWVIVPTVLLLIGGGLMIAEMASGGMGGIGVAVMIAGAITGIVLLVWACQQGTRGPNRFG